MKKKLIFLNPGPIRKIADMSKYVELSDYFTGDIIISSNKEDVLRTKHIGSFNLHTIRFSYSAPIMISLKFLLYCLLFAIKSRILGKKYDLVVTYDPLRSGVLGAIIASVIKANFAPEVNGVYTSAAEYLDNGNSLYVKVKKVVYPVVEAVVLRKADGIKIQFPNQLEPFKEVIKNKVVHRFPNYVHVDRFIDLEMTEEKEILFVGFPFKRKGVDILIKAFKLIAPKFPQWRLKILGWFPNRNELMRCISGHPQIYYHPPVSTTEIPNFMGSCSIFALASRSDALPRVLVEAMAAGKPRVGTNVDGIPLLINDRVDGLLCEPENVQDLAEKLEFLMRDGELRKRLGNAGRERALREFSKKRYFENLLRFYGEVIG